MADELVTIRYFAGARAAAGADTDTVPIAGATTVAQVLDALVRRRGDKLATVLPACSFLLNGVAVHDQGARVPSGAELDVLPPFAGG